MNLNPFRVRLSRAVLLPCLCSCLVGCGKKETQVQSTPRSTIKAGGDGQTPPAVDLNALGQPVPMDGGTAQARSGLVAQVEARQQVNDSPNAVTINLKPYVNVALTDPLPITLGQTDITFAALLSGVHTYGGVSFDVEGLIQLNAPGLSPGGRDAGSADAKTWPLGVTNIAINSKFTRLHLMHSAWDINGPRYRATFATMVLHYTDGSTSELQLAGGTHALRCLGPYVPPLLGLIQPPQTELAWLGTNPFLMQNAPNQGLHLFRATLSNPKPGLEVTSIDYMSAMGDGDSAVGRSDR